MASKDTTPLLIESSTDDDTAVETTLIKSVNTDSKDEKEKEHLYDPEIEGSGLDFSRRSMAVSSGSSMMHLIKGNVGTGILAMPSAIMYAGLWVGFFGLGFIGIIAIHCMHLLVQASNRLCQRAGTNSLDYGEVAEKAFHYGPGKLPRFATAARLTVNLFICITQFGFCIVYVLFIAQNIQQFIEHFVSWHLPVQVYEVIVLILLIFYSFVKSLKYLAPFSSFANVITFIGLLVILEYCFHDLPSVDNYPAFNSWKTLPLFFGIAIYAFEGIAVVLPIENSMRSPEDFRGLSGVLNTSMVIVTAMYMAVGFYGYLKFGNDIAGSITLNLPNTPLYLTVKLIFALSIFISYGLQFYVPAQFVFPPLSRRFPAACSSYAADSVLRIVFVIFTFMLAAVIPHLDLMISLIGALASSALALIFPPLLEMLTLGSKGMGRCKWRLIKNVFIMIFGILGFVTGTVVTLIRIVDTFKNGDV